MHTVRNDITVASIPAQDMPKKPPVTRRPILGRRAATQPAPLVRSLDELRHEAASCKACPLWEPATQTVFGEGARHATIVFIGEQPGDTEDIAGRPFIGPAGQMLDRALAEAGIDRRQVYVTNAVKHFKFERRGKRRLHKKPADAEIDACYRWLERELEMIKPTVIVALGASAARAVLGHATPIGSNRGRLVPLSASTQLIITVHPSFLLRIRGEAKDAEYRRFVADLKLASPFLGINKH